MTVLDIIVLTMGFSAGGHDVHGKVQLTLRDMGGSTRTLTMECHCQGSARIRPDAILVGDAIRQLRRLPEVRRGVERLQFAKGLRPLREAEAA